MIKTPNKEQNTQTCPNCGSETDGNFCANCGQSTADVNISVKHFFKDFLGDYFTFDSKFFRSIIPLLIRPGFLTNEHTAGRRVRYIPPMRMYIFMSVIFFFILSTSSHKSDMVKFTEKSDEADSTAVVSESFPMETSALLDSIGVTEAPMAGSNAQMDSSMKKGATDSTGVITDKVIKASRNKEKFRSNFVSNLPRMMFFLLPVFALMLKLVYVRSKILYVRHLVFSLHFHTFVFFLLSLFVFISNFIKDISPETGGFLGRAILICMLVYLVIDLKVVYRQGWLKTVVKLGLLTVSYVFLLGVAMIGVFIVSLALI